MERRYFHHPEVDYLPRTAPNEVLYGSYTKAAHQRFEVLFFVFFVNKMNVVLEVGCVHSYARSTVYNVHGARFSAHVTAATDSRPLSTLSSFLI